MNLEWESNPTESLLHEKTSVPYGQVRSVNKEGIIGTIRLYACVGVILMNESRVTLTHFPTMDTFGIFVPYDDGVIRSMTSNFDQLMADMFSEFGVISNQSEAMIVGGVKKVSSHIIQKIKKELKKNGLIHIKTKGPHGKNVEWDVEVNHGILNINSRHRSIHSHGETSY